MNLRKCTFAILLTLLSAASLANDIESQQTQEIDNYIEKLSNVEGTELYDLANLIRFSGLSDKRLFDKIEELVKTKHLHLMETGDDEDSKVIQIKILIMALASSGDSNYWMTLESLVNDSSIRNVRNRAHQSMRNLGFYHKRNKIMQNYSLLSEGQSLQTRRTLNLLQSDDKTFSRYAAEGIHRIGRTEPEVLEWIAAQLEIQVHQAKNKVHLDMLAWYCKVLAKVNKQKYTPLLTKIIKDKSIPSKIRSHAKKAMKEK